MAGVYKGLRIEISADDGDLQKALNRNQREATKLQRELKQVERSLKFNSKSPEMLAQKMQKIGLQVTNTEAKLKLLRQAEREIGRAGMGEQKWVELQGDIAACEARLQAYKAQLREIAAMSAVNASGLGKVGGFLADNTEVFTKVGTGMQTVGRTLTHTITPAFALAAAGSVKAAADIDSALTGVRKTVDATDEEYQQLKEHAIEYSKVNAVSATDVLNAEELGGQLGVAKENLEAFAKVTTSLDIATNMNVEDASSEMARFFNVTQQVADQSKTATEQYEAYGNVIVGLGNNLATTESEISAFSLRMASAGALAGMSQAEIMGIGGAMSSLGLEAEAGGTAFSRTITQISMAVSQGGEDLEGFARVAGMSSDEFAAKWKDDAAGAFTDFIVGLAAGNEAGEDMNLMLDELGITAIRQSDAMRRLAGNTDLVKDAIELATNEWNSGNAMFKEVENRNDSLAAKFEMLKNRILAVADEVGAPVAEALLDVVDAAEPLFEAIENGARAFSEMSKEEQQAILQTAGFLMVLGPMTNGLGAIIRNLGPAGEGMQALAQGFAKIDMIGAGANAASAAEGITEVGTAAKGASVGMGALKAGLGLVAIAMVGLAASYYADAYDAFQDFQGSTEGLVDAAEATKTALDDALGGFNPDTTGFDEYARSAREAADAGDRLADKIANDFNNAAADSAAVQYYADVISNLAGNCDGSAEKVADLKVAVDEYNRLTGGNVQVVSDYSGAIDQNTAAFEANTKAFMNNLMAKAAEEDLTEIAKERYQLQKDLAAKEEELAQAEEHRAEAAKNVNAETADLDTSMVSYDAAVSSLESEVNSLNQQLEANDQAFELVSDSAQSYKAAADEASKAAEDAAPSMDKLRAAVEAGGGDVAFFDQWAAGVGDVSGQIEQAGISTDDFVRMGTANFQRLSEEANGDLSKILDAVDVMNAKNIEAKDLHITEDGITDAEGNLIKLDEFQVDDKEMAVTANTSSADKDLDVTGKKADRVGRMRPDIRATATTSAADSKLAATGRRADRTGMKRPNIKADATTSSANSKLGATSSKAAALGRQSPTIKVRADTETAWSKLHSLSNFRLPTLIQRIVTQKNAAGGISIPAHMAGAIVTQATLTDMGIVGEAGAEAILQGAGGNRAIVPLSNRRYVRPFAQAVAAEMGGSRSVVNNSSTSINLNYNADSSAKQMVRDVAREFRLQGLAG